MNREHLERLLREPNNLFGKPRGAGYDYWRNGTIFASVCLSFVSAAAFLWVFRVAQVDPALRIVGGIAAAPFTLASLILWPVDVLGLFSAFAIWYGTLRAVTWRFHKAGRWQVWALAAGIGWSLAGVRSMFLFW